MTTRFEEYLTAQADYFCKLRCRYKNETVFGGEKDEVEVDCPKCEAVFEVVVSQASEIAPCETCPLTDFVAMLLREKLPPRLNDAAV